MSNANVMGELTKHHHVTTGNTLTIDSGASLIVAGTFTADDLTVSDDLTVTDDLAVTGLVTVGETLAVTGALTHKRNYSSLTTASPAALTAAQSGTLFAFNRAAGVAVALPAVTAAEVGVEYHFVFETTATGDHTITAQAGDLLKGGLTIWDFDAAYDSATRDGRWWAADGSDDLIITMNGTTKGGKVGSWLTLRCTSATSWLVTGQLAGDGVIVTPFS